MEPQAEHVMHSPPRSGSQGSQEHCPSEHLTESYNEDDDSESEYPLGLQNAHMPSSQSAECLHLQDRESVDSQGPLLKQSDQDESDSHQENYDFYSSASRESLTESPNIHDLHKQSTLTPECPESKLWQHSNLSSSSPDCFADMTKALTLSSKWPQVASNRQGPGTENRRVESSEEGGSSEAPPASVFFGISDEGAEQAETRNLGSDRDLCTPDRQRARHTWFSHRESHLERHVKETKSKCKRIAQLLVNAPNPQNKGALLFKKRRQRVKKYTLVSYGTGGHTFDNSGQIEGQTDKVRSAGYAFCGSSNSESEEQYFQHQQYHNQSLNWRSGQDMDVLPETKGKGLLMFAQRRKRIDELVSEPEGERSEGFSEEVLKETQHARLQNIYESKQMYMHAEDTNLRDGNPKTHMDYRADIQEVNHLSTVLKPMVPNRTARPFLGLQVSPTLETATVSGGVSLAMKKHELAFKIPFPINSNPKVWSPTGDIIASRDERISVPAIKSGILPEPKRKTANKKPSVSVKESELFSQSKGERKSYIEAEEDFFSLGAEACNFMQPKPIKLKNPPPVAPKPYINPACPPWSSSSRSYIPSRSPMSQPSHSPVGLHGQHYLQQQDWPHPQQMASHWASDQTEASLQTPANARVPINSSQLHLQPTTNSWSQQASLSPVSKQAHSPTYSPLSHSKNKSDSTPNLVDPCTTQAGRSSLQSPKSLDVSPKLRLPCRSVNKVSDRQTMAGKGAKLFSKRQSRMEKFVIDVETVQANKTRSPSPTSSLPNSWRYSCNIHAPPPLSYNPLLSPFYPPLATKQPPSTRPKTKAKSKQKSKSGPKQLNALDIMKHQPYKLDSSLFMYDASAEAKCPSPKPNPVSKFEVTKNLKQKVDSSYSPYNPSDPAGQSKAEAPAKASKSVFGKSRSLSLLQRLNSFPSAGLPSPLSIPGGKPAFSSAQRQSTFYRKPLTPWEAASRSPLGSVDEAFMSQRPLSSVSSDVMAEAHHKSLPEPPEEWKRRVSLDSATPYQNPAPSFQALSLSRLVSPEKPAFYGPPFRPALPLRPVSLGFKLQSPHKLPLFYSNTQRS